MNMYSKPVHGLRKNPDYACMTIIVHTHRLHPGLYHVELRDRHTIHHPLIAEAAQVEATVGAIGDQFGDGAADGGRLLQPVPAEPVGEVKVPDLRMWPQYRVLVERVVVVVPDPGPYQLDRLEGGYAVRQGRPHHVFVQPMVDLEVSAVRIFGLRRRDPADEVGALWPTPHARRIDGERRPRRLVAAVEYIDDALARPHRKADADHAGDLMGVIAGGIHHRIAGEAAAVAQGRARNAVADAFEVGHLVGC